MTAPASPSILTPPPKRAPGVKRLNRVPIAIGCGVGLMFIGAVAYTMVQRAQTTEAATAGQDAKKGVTGGKPPGFLMGKQDHGEIQASLTGRDPGMGGLPPAKTDAGTPPANPPAAAPVTSGTDLDEQARARAWATYYQQRDALQAARFEMEKRAREGGNDPLQSSMGAGSQIPGIGSPTDPSALPPRAPPIAGASGAPDGPYSTGGTDPNGQTGKQAFLRTPGDPLGMNEDLPGSVHPPKPNTVMEGTPIPGRLVDGATSDSPGQLVAEVSTNVYDDMTGTTLLIPQFTRIITTYDTAVSAGQDRIGVISQRLIFPDTSSRQLGSMQIADQAGMAGLKDIVRTHFWEKFWATAIISIAGAGAQLAQPQQSAFSGYSPSSVATGQLTQGFSQLGQSYAQRGLSIPNTIELRPGLQLVIKPNHDITLAAVRRSPRRRRSVRDHHRHGRAAGSVKTKGKITACQPGRRRARDHRPVQPGHAAHRDTAGPSPLPRPDLCRPV